MENVFQKTRELGTAIMESDVYQKMKALEEKAMANQQASETMGKYLEKKQQIQDMLSEENPNPAQLKALSTEMEALQGELQSIDDIVRLTEARNEFSNLINQVNSVLRFIITGEMTDPDAEGSGCSGSCQTCGGCGNSIN